MLWVDTTRILAIFAVVCLHVAACVVTGTDTFGNGPWWICNGYNALGRWCVPVFVMLSGALLLAEDKTETLPEFYRKRASRLLLPLLFWSAFFLAWTYLRGVLLHDVPSLPSLGRSLLAGKPYFHMWFLYMLIGLYFATPFLRVLVRHLSVRDAAVLVTAAFCLSAIHSADASFHARTGSLFIFWFLTYMPYFLVGHLIRTSSWQPNRTAALLVFAFSAFCTAVACFLVGRSHGLEKGLYFYSPLSLTVIPMSISVMFLAKNTRIPIGNVQLTRRLAGLVLGIYLIHPIIMDVLRYGGINALRCNPLISVPVLGVLVFALAALVTWVMHMIPYVRRVI